MLGLSTSILKGVTTLRSYIKDGLKLYMPFRGGHSDEVKFVGTGSTSFDGTDDYISASYTLPVDIYTISLWVKFDSTDTALTYLFDNRDGSNVDAMAIFTEHSGSNRRLVINHSNAYVLTTAYDLDLDAWTHITIVKDGATFTLYKDGVLWDSDAGNDNSSNGATFIFGARYNISSFLDGYMKNFAIWSRALTATEVQNVMYKTYDEVGGRLASGLVSWWALDATDSLGSELITVEADRTFASDTGYWSKDTGVTIADGVCRFSNVSANQGLYDSGSVLSAGTSDKIFQYLLT